MANFLELASAVASVLFVLAYAGFFIRSWVRRMKGLEREQRALTRDVVVSASVATLSVLLAELAYIRWFYNRE